MARGQHKEQPSRDHRASAAWWVILSAIGALIAVAATEAARGHWWAAGLAVLYAGTFIALAFLTWLTLQLAGDLRAEREERAACPVCGGGEAWIAAMEEGAR